MNYDAVFFDVGGTLIHGEPTYLDIYVRACRDCGALTTCEDIGRGLTAAWGPYRVDGGILPPGVSADAETYAAWERQIELDALRHAGIAGDLERICDYLVEVKRNHANWTVYPDARRALEALASMGIKMAVISNWDWRLPDLLNELGLGRYFSFVAVSARTGYAKPHPFIFKQALKLARVRPHRALYVGDDYQFDILAAQRLGIPAVLVDREMRGNRNCTIVSSLDDLPRLLGHARAA